MPAVISSSVDEQNDSNQKMWNALKRYIIRERQRKKEGITIITFTLYNELLFYVYEKFIPKTKVHF